MNVAVITERISSSIQAGALRPVCEPTSSKAVERISDLLQPWEDFYPGIDPLEEGESRNIFTCGLVRKPLFISRPRRSARPLPAPRRLAASPLLLSPGLFAAVQGIWEYYQQNNIPAVGNITQPFDNDGMTHFIDPLYNKTSDYWPLHVNLESLLNDCDVREIHQISLMLPHYTYDDDTTGVIESFFSGADGLTSLLHHYRGEDHFKELPPEDHHLFIHPGIPSLCAEYASYSGEKRLDLAKLENWPDTWFADVKARFPEQMQHDWPLISGDYGEDAEISITSSQDIDFALAYAETYYRMMDSIPDPADIESNDLGSADELVHEICEIWRKSNRKRSVKWTNQKPNTISNRIKRGEL